MNKSPLRSVAALALALGVASVSALAQEHGHGSHHAHEAPVSQVPADHVPWTPDAPLVEGMARVRTAVAGLAHHDMGHLDEASVLALAGDIDAAIEYMFAHCKLEPAPDVALHGVLARLMAGTRDLREAPADAAPVAGMRTAVADYGRLFDDPGKDAPPAQP